jgi:ubiquitin C-terminal hydrolase
MKIKRLPNVLAVHLKRFKFQEQLGRFSKLSNRVCFTEQLRLFNTADEAVNSERLYELCAIIIHIGSGPHHGHYVAAVKNRNQWLLFDDEDVIVRRRLTLGDRRH